MPYLPFILFPPALIEEHYELNKQSNINTFKSKKESRQSGLRKVN